MNGLIEHLGFDRVYVHPHRDQAFGCVSYAQHGDDLMILNIFKLLGKDKPSYIDVGAHHPEHISNTKLLYDRGSRGINIEANKNLIQAFIERRPGDTNLCVGVAPKNGTMTFHMYDQSSGRNTFSSEEVGALTGIMEVRETVELPVVTLNSLVDRLLGGEWPDILSIDIEGLDYEVLEVTDFDKDPPILIVVETRRVNTDKMALMLLAKGFYYYCRMGENLFFIHRNYHTKLY